MKRLYLSAAFAALGLAAIANVPASVNILHKDLNAVPQNGRNHTDFAVPAFVPVTATRSVDEPQTKFIAENAAYYVYDSGMYYIFLSTCDMVKGNPVGEGQYIRIVLNGDPTDDPAKTPIPTGTFGGSDDFDPGSFNYDYTIIMDVFENPDNPGSGELVGYQYHPIDGTLEITEKDGSYAIKMTFSGQNLYEGYEDDIRECEVEYAGEIPFVDINAYTPLDGDTELHLYGASGRYVEGGNFSICFYSEGLIDDEGWIVNAGELMNMELFVEPAKPMDPESLLGTFTPFDMMGGELVPGRFAQGIWYEAWGMYMPIGTSLTNYDAYGDMLSNGLAKDGTITITRDGNDFTVAFDLVTFEDHKITGSWTGDLLAFVEDQTSGVDTVAPDSDSIRGGIGCVVAPVDAHVYNMAGAPVGRTSLPGGIYVVKSGDVVKKVLVK